MSFLSRMLTAIYSTGPGDQRMRTLAAGAIAAANGAMLGVAQWLVLRRVFAHSSRWVVTWIAWTSAWVMLGRFDPSGFVVGASIGCWLQWRMLRRHIRRAGWWFPISVIALTAGGMVALMVAVSLSLRFGAVAGEHNGWTSVVGWIVGMAVYGLVTGVALDHLVADVSDATVERPGDTDERYGLQV